MATVLGLNTLAGSKVMKKKKMRKDYRTSFFLTLLTHFSYHIISAFQFLSDRTDHLYAHLHFHI